MRVHSLLLQWCCFGGALLADTVVGPYADHFAVPHWPVPGVRHTALIDFQQRTVTDCRTANCTPAPGARAAYLLLPVPAIATLTELHTRLLFPLHRWTQSLAKLEQYQVVLVRSGGQSVRRWLRDALDLLVPPPALWAGQLAGRPAQVAEVVYGVPPLDPARLPFGFVDGLRAQAFRALRLPPVIEPLRTPAVLCVAVPCDVPPQPDVAVRRTAGAALRTLLPQLQLATVVVLTRARAALGLYVRPHARVVVLCSPPRAAPWLRHVNAVFLRGCPPHGCGAALAPHVARAALRRAFHSRLIEDSKRYICGPWAAWYTGHGSARAPHVHVRPIESRVWECDARPQQRLPLCGGRGP